MKTDTAVACSQVLEQLAAIDAKHHFPWGGPTRLTLIRARRKFGPVASDFFRAQLELAKLYGKVEGERIVIPEGTPELGKFKEEERKLLELAVEDIPVPRLTDEELAGALDKAGGDLPDELVARMIEVGLVAE